MPTMTRIPPMLIPPIRLSLAAIQRPFKGRECVVREHLARSATGKTASGLRAGRGLGQLARIAGEVALGGDVLIELENGALEGPAAEPRVHVPHDLA